MKFTLTIECDCGMTSTIPLKRTTHAHEDGRVYEDYTSITDSMKGNEHVKGEVHPEWVYVTCKGCGKKHDLSI